MAHSVEQSVTPALGTLLQEHHAVVTLGRELIRLSIGARVANRIDEAVAAEQAAEDYFAEAMQLEERLRSQL